MSLCERVGGKEGRKEGGRERGREGGREAGREGGREEGGEGEIMFHELCEHFLCRTGGNQHASVSGSLGGACQTEGDDQQSTWLVYNAMT